MPFGGRALSSLRLEKNYGSFNKDFRPDYTPAETGLDRFVDFGKPDFVGRAAALAEREAGPKRRFVVMEVDARDADVVGYESIMQGRQGGRLRHLGRVRALRRAQPRRGLRADGAGPRRRALRDRHPRPVLCGHRALQPLYDPEGLRLRG